MLTKKLGAPIDIGEPRALTREDLSVLALPRNSEIAFPAKLRESHHSVARLLSLGMSHQEVADRTGYSYARVSVLAVAPAMIELVEKYRAKVDDSFTLAVDEYHSLLLNNMIASERHIADHIADLDELGDLLPVKTALAIARDGADRLGYGKKKETTVNLNLDFAARLESAIQRSGKMIDVTRSEAPLRSGLAAAASPARQLAAPQGPIRRRA